jgi:hypothetical protein
MTSETHEFTRHISTHHHNSWGDLQLTVILTCCTCDENFRRLLFPKLDKLLPGMRRREREALNHTYLYSPIKINSKNGFPNVMFLGA